MELNINGNVKFLTKGQAKSGTGVNPMGWEHNGSRWDTWKHNQTQVFT